MDVSLTFWACATLGVTRRRAQSARRWREDAALRLSGGSAAQNTERGKKGLKVAQSSARQQPTTASLAKNSCKHLWHIGRSVCSTPSCRAAGRCDNGAQAKRAASLQQPQRHRGSASSRPSSWGAGARREPDEDVADADVSDAAGGIAMWIGIPIPAAPCRRCSIICRADKLGLYASPTFLCATAVRGGVGDLAFHANIDGAYWARECWRSRRPRAGELRHRARRAHRLRFTRR